MREPKTEHLFGVEVSGIPDGAGLRIKSTGPWGVYVSSVDPGRAQRCFCQCLVQFAIGRRLLTAVPGGGAKLAETQIDWDAMLLNGSGQIGVVVFGAAEGRVVRMHGSPIPHSAKEEMRMEWWRSPQGSLVIASDPGDRIDGWIVDAVTADLKAAKAAKLN